MGEALLRVSMRLESIETIIRLVKSYLGLTLLPEITVKEEIAKGILKVDGVKRWMNFSVKLILIAYIGDISFSHDQIIDIRTNFPRKIPAYICYSAE
jgi:hypothetical protein